MPEREATGQAGRVAAEPPPGLRRAQDLARAIAAEASALLRPGLSEIAWQRAADQIAVEHGSLGAWTPVTSRVGLGTLVAHPQFPMQDRLAQEGDPAILDLTPTAPGGWLGDYCVSLSVGTAHPETASVVADCRAIQQAMIAAVRPGMPASELYAVGARLCAEHEVKLLDLLDNFGHSIGREFAAEGFVDADNDTPMWGAWTIEPHVGRRARGAKFEDIVWLAPSRPVVVV